MIVCITSVGTATSVGLIKALKKCDIVTKIIGMDINEYGYTAGSQMVDLYYKVPLADDESYRDSVLNIIRIENVDVFIPVNDLEIKEASGWTFPVSCKVILPSKKVIDLVQDKYKCSVMLGENGIQIPRIIGVKGEKYIYRERKGVGSKGIKIIDDLFDDCNEGFLQKYIDGCEYTVDCLCDEDGKPLYIIPRARLEIKAGVSTKTRIVKEEVLIDQTKKILSVIKLPGFSCTQFIVNDDGAYYIETNPRLGGGTAASFCAAENLIKRFLYLYDLSEQKCDVEKTMLNDGVKWGLVVTRYYEERVFCEGI